MLTMMLCPALQTLDAEDPLDSPLLLRKARIWLECVMNHRRTGKERHHGRTEQRRVPTSNTHDLPSNTPCPRPSKGSEDVPEAGDGLDSIKRKKCENRKRWGSRDVDVGTSGAHKSTPIAMLRVERLPEILENVLHDGVSGAVLMTTEGSILCSKFVPESDMTETTLAAISSNIWGNLVLANPDVNFHISKLDEGCVGVTVAGRGHLVVAYGANIGMLRGRLEALSGYFARVFENIADSQNA